MMANDIITHLNDEATQGKLLNQVLDEDARARQHLDPPKDRARKGQGEPIELTIVRASPRSGARQGPIFKSLSRMASFRSRLVDRCRSSILRRVRRSQSSLCRANEFFVDGGDHTRLVFLRDEVGKATDLVLNPGPWQITGQRIN